MIHRRLINRHCFALVRPRRQRGAALFVALVFLILLTLIAVGSANVATMQERMVGGLRNMQLASNGAESALREAEARLWSASAGGTPIFSGSQGIDGNAYAYSATVPAEVPQKFRRDASFLPNYGLQTYRTTDLTTVGGSGNLASKPVYLIEDLGVDVPPSNGNQARQAGYNGDTTTGAGNGATNHIYRITARSSGGSANTSRTLESTFNANPTASATSSR